MKRVLLLLILLGVTALVMRRLFQSEEGAIERGAAQAAGTVRQRGPGLVDSVAQGIEKVGGATEQGTKTLRDATEKGTETIRQMTSAVGDDAALEPQPEEPRVE